MAVKVGNIVVNFKTNLAEFQSNQAKIVKSLRSTGREFTAAGKALTTHLTLPMVAFGAAVGKMANDVQKGLATIRTGTGATGQALEALGNSARAVARQVPNDFGQVSTAIADLNTRLGLSGKQLEVMSTQMLNLARITNKDVGSVVTSATRVFGQWQVATEKQAQTLDYLFKAGQQSGIGIDRLMTSVVQYGAQLKSFGFDIEQSASLLAMWEKEGVNMEAALAGLSMGLNKFVKAGKDPGRALIDLEKRMKAAKDETEALDLAAQAFGRSGATIGRAILDGRMNMESFAKAIADSSDTINKAAEDSMTFSERLAVMRNRAMLAAEPLGNALLQSFGKLIPYIDKVLNLATKLGEGFAALPSGAQFAIVAFAGVVAAIGPVLWMFGSLVTSVAAAIPVLTKLTTALLASGGLVVALKAAALVGAFWVGWRLGELLNKLEWVNAAGEKFASWIVKIPGIAPNVKGALTGLEFTTQRLADRLKELGVNVERMANESLEDWNKRVLEAARNLQKMKEETEAASKVTGAAASNISAMSEEVRKLLNPMDDLSTQLATFSAEGMNAQQVIQLYAKDIVHAADMQRLLTGELTDAQRALAAKSRAYIDLTSQRDTSKFSLLDYVGVLENYNDALFRNAELIDRQKQAEAERNEMFKVQIPDSLWPDDPLPRDPRRKKTIDELMRDVIRATDDARKAQDRYSGSMSVFGREVSTIFTNMTQSIAGNIIEWKGWASTILGTIKSLAKAALSALIQGLFTPMMNWLNKLGGGIGIGGGSGIGGLTSAFGGKALGGLLGIGGAGAAAGTAGAATGTAATGATLGAGLAGSAPIATGGGAAAGTTGGAAGGFSLGGALAGVGGAIQGGATAAMGAIGLGFLPAAAAIPVVGGIAAGAILGGMKLASWAKGPNAWQAAAKEVKRDYGVTMSDKQIAAFFQSMGISESTAWGVRWPLLKSPQFQAYMMSLGKSPSMSKQGDDYKAAHELAKLGDWSAYNELFLNEFGNIHSGTLDKITGWYDKLTVAASSGMADIPKYQSGIDFVPRDGLAYLHRGERVTPANENRHDVRVRLGDMHLTFNVGGSNTADMVQTFRNQIIPILKREMQGGPTGLREAIRAANATTARAY